MLRMTWTALCVGLVGCASSTPGETRDASGPTADAGNSGDATQRPDGSATADGAIGEMCCLSATLSWGYEGGLVCTRDHSELTPCDTFVHTRTPEACGDVRPLSCTHTLACARALLGVSDVYYALAQPDVQAALARGGLLGVDPRPYDGALFSVSLGTSNVLIGDDCPVPSGTCVPVLAALRSLEMVLTQLTTQTLREGECSTVFPSG